MDPQVAKLFRDLVLLLEEQEDLRNEQITVKAYRTTLNAFAQSVMDACMPSAEPSSGAAAQALVDKLYD